MAETLRLVVELNGNVVAVYDDALVPTLSALGPSVVERASHVEPVSTVRMRRFSPGMMGWVADMSPVGGAVLTSDGAGGYLENRSSLLDGRPFESRAAALLAERAWLREHLGL